jgi:two-component system, sensor histidine kinase and response regulator
VRVQASLKVRQLTSENQDYYHIAKAQRDALIRLQLQKEQLTAFLVHDLKNPLSSLDMHAQLLVRDKSISERGQASVAAIRQEARQLMRLLTNMLEISKSESDQLTARKSPIQLTQMVSTLKPEFELRARSKNVAIDTAVEVDNLDADPDMLRRVVENLLDNAIRHAPIGSRVTLTARVDQGSVELRVADQGTGVPPDAREQVFERFVQASKAKSGEHSYGLGLAFCKLAADLHGGRIWIEDAGPGAVFCVRFPC